MTTGRLTQKIQIMARANISDGYAGYTPNNVLYWETFADVKALRSSRTLEANQSPLKQSYSFTIRYRKDKNLENDMLVVWRGDYYVITGYTPDVVYQEYVKFDALATSSGDIVR